MKKKLFFAMLAAATFVTFSCSKDDDKEDLTTINFSDLTLGANSSWNGSDGSGYFVSGGATFNNKFTDWGGGITSWNGFGYSNKNDTTTADFTNDFSVYTKTVNTNGNFAVAYMPDTTSITFSLPVELRKADFALNTDAYKSMKNGDSKAKKFAAGDWYKIKITGYAANDNDLSIDVYLADFREGKSILVDDWTNVDLSALGSVKKLTFEASSSDNGQWGMNTPAYFCIDNITYKE